MDAVTLYPVVVSRRPEDEDHAPLLAYPAAARLIPAGEVAAGRR
ncbi:hypothetical protein [Streptomyces axinellae]|uniref:Uncharacterized protein n=1 Tax=Streptomyces axinellae TaxID=552788 RepID=A0ABN3R018_9ACTN